MKQSPVLEFESSSFAMEQDEDLETNPGIGGKSLAAWLAAQLQYRQIETGEILAKDCGWCVPVGSWPHRTYIACARENGQVYKWRVFAFAESGILTRLLCNDDSGISILEAYRAIRLILKSAAGVRALTELQG